MERLLRCLDVHSAPESDPVIGFVPEDRRAPTGVESAVAACAPGHRQALY